jgi:pyridoxal phosphate enzyme (YggS family)
MSTTEIARNLERLQTRISDLSGKTPDSVHSHPRLLAVSKTVEPDLIRIAYAAGQRAFGENRVQELARKAPLLPADCQWHLIGHLQRNKVRQAVQAADWIHSIDSGKLLERIERIAEEEERCPSVLLQVNVTGEGRKEGVEPGDVGELVAAALACRHLKCLGFMTMAPFGISFTEAVAVFGRLRDLRDRVQTEFGAELPELSMGMSGDFEAAITAGATWVRIGAAIFGERT